jgi:hypothetical protein
MAAIVVSQTVTRWTGNQTSRAGYMRALEPNSETARKDLETMVLGLPHFEVYGTTDTNTAASVAINLTTQGVTFPDATQRVILARARVADNDGQGIVESKSVVDGGSTPIVVTDSADADPLVSGLGGTPTLVMSVSTADVILTAVGISAVPCRWLIEIWVGDALPLAYHS